MERAYLLGGLLAAAGLALSARALPRAARALSFKLQRGKPYVPGSLRRALATLLLGLAVTGAGVQLAGARWLLRDFGPAGAAARVRVTGEPGALLLELETAGAGGRKAVRAVGLAGADWQVQGVIVTFPEWTEPLGLGTLHRIVEAGDPGAAPSPLDDPAGLLSGLPPWAGVEVARRSLAGTGPLPAWTGLRATRDGYLLGGPAPDATDGGP
jgi:hypothetical protein